jgi:hypothetical protein
MGRPPVVNDHRADASQHDFSIFRRDTLTAAEGDLAARSALAEFKLAA